MINMKQAHKSDTLLAECCTSDAPEYPYGLRLGLDTDALTKLGIAELPEVGTVLKLVARVEVVSVSQYEHADGKSKDLGLQITDMELEREGETQKPQNLYPNSNML